MTEYTATCAIDEADTITAARYGRRVELEPSGTTEVYLDPAPARTFARGILALADEIDGGEKAEVKADTRPKVGDRVRVTKYKPWAAPCVTGDVVTVSETKYDDPQPGREDFIRYRGDTGYAWGIPLTAVQPVTETRTPKVGDTVRIVKDDAVTRPGEYVGLVGTLTIDDGTGAHNRYKVQFGDGSGRHGDKVNGAWCVPEVEVVDVPEPAPADEPSSPSAKYLREARTFLEGIEYGPGDIVLVARFLAEVP